MQNKKIKKSKNKSKPNKGKNSKFRKAAPAPKKSRINNIGGMVDRSKKKQGIEINDRATQFLYEKAKKSKF